MSVIQWFPGHMAKTINELRESIKACDLVVEVCDARIVNSSRNPILDDIISDKKRVIALNKQDLADPEINKLWLSYLQKLGTQAILIDARNKSDTKRLEHTVIEMTQDIIEKALSRGRRNRPIRILVAGIPNSGKSTLINSLIGKKKAKTANKPGVTRQLQWLKLGQKLQLLDSPGILWPKLESRQEQIALGACAAVKDDIMPREQLAGELLVLLCTLYPTLMQEHYDLNLSGLIELTKEEQGSKFLEQVAQYKNLLKQGGLPDLDRVAQFVLKQFREGSLGKISLDWPDRDNVL